MLGPGNNGREEAVAAVIGLGGRRSGRRVRECGSVIGGDGSGASTVEALGAVAAVDVDYYDSASGYVGEAGLGGIEARGGGACSADDTLEGEPRVGGGSAAKGRPCGWAA